jgi:hypothetical protein
MSEEYCIKTSEVNLTPEFTMPTLYSLYIPQGWSWQGVSRGNPFVLEMETRGDDNNKRREGEYGSLEGGC